MAVLMLGEGIPCQEIYGHLQLTLGVLRWVGWFLFCLHVSGRKSFRSELKWSTPPFGIDPYKAVPDTWFWMVSIFMKFLERQVNFSRIQVNALMVEIHLRIQT